MGTHSIARNARKRKSTASGASFNFPPEVEEGIVAQANRFAFQSGCYHLREDLAQEGRIAAWKQLQEDPDSPVSYVLADSRQAMIWRMCRGKSVDGKPWKTRYRDFQYDIVSLEKPLPSGDLLLDTLSQALVSPTLSVEQQAMGNLMIEEIVAMLTEQERLVFEGRCIGYSTKGLARERDDLSRYFAQQAHRTLREKVAAYLASTHETPE
jgi:hypothetical protein